MRSDIVLRLGAIALAASLAASVAGLVTGWPLTRAAAYGSFAVAAGLIGYFFVLRKRMKRSAEWPSTLGTITAAGADALRYSYAVDGRSYDGERVRWDERASARARLAQAYPAGAAVAVYYDPDEPANAVLEPHAIEPAAGIAMLAMIHGLIGMLMSGAQISF